MTPALSAIPKQRGTKSELASSPCLLGGPQVGGKATSPLHSQGFPKMGIKSELTATPVPSRGPKSGQKYDITPPFSGIPKPRVKNQKWPPLPCLLGGPQVGGNATSPLHSRGSPNKGDKIRIGYLMLACSGAHKRAEMLHHPCVLGDPQTKGGKIRIGYFTLAFFETHQWAERLQEPCILGDPKTKGDKIKSGHLSLAFSGAHKWAALLHHPCIPRVS